MKKYSIKGFTKEENEDIVDKYGEWMKPENVVWVEKEYRDNIKYYEYQEIEKFIDDYFKELDPIFSTIATCENGQNMEMGENCWNSPILTHKVSH